MIDVIYKEDDEARKVKMVNFNIHKVKYVGDVEGMKELGLECDGKELDALELYIHTEVESFIFRITAICNIDSLDKCKKLINDFILKAIEMKIPIYVRYTEYKPYLTLGYETDKPELFPKFIDQITAFKLKTVIVKWYKLK